MPASRAQPISRHIVERRRERAKPGLRKPHALAPRSPRSPLGQAGLEDDRSRMHPHAAGPIMLEALARRDRERFDAFRVARPARHMHFGGADRRRDAAVQIAFEKADGLLPRRVVAKGDMDMAVDQARDGGGAGGVDDDVAALELRRPAVPTGDPAAVERTVSPSPTAPPVAA